MESGYPHILLINSAGNNTQELALNLSSSAYNVTQVNSGEEGIRQVSMGNYDMVVLDTMLPKLDGFEVLKQIRLQFLMPVMMLTPSKDAFDHIYALELGADDCVEKPADPRALLAIIRARLRRESYASNRHLLTTIGIDKLLVDMTHRRVSYDHATLDLTDTEFSIVELLAVNKGEVVSRKAISERIFKRKFESFDRSIDMHMSNLRKKLSEQLAPNIIKTIRGNGYMLVQPAARSQ